MDSNSYNESIPNVQFRLKFIIVFLIVLLIGFVLLIVSHYLDTQSLWKLLMEQLSTAFIIGSFTGILYEYFMRKEFISSTQEQTKILHEGICKLSEEAKQRAEKITDYFSGHVEQKEIGLTHCYKEVDRFDFAGIIEEAPELIVVLNDGRTWVGNYFQRFQNRFSDQNKKTTFVLLHPESDALKLQAFKVGGDAMSIKMKISETIREIKKANKNNNNNVFILGHKFYSTLSVFVTDRVAIVTPYFVSKVRQTPPVFVFERTSQDCFYNKLRTDVGSLICDAEDIKDYQYQHLL